jgi:hypothetical protein
MCLMNFVQRPRDLSCPIEDRASNGFVVVGFGRVRVKFGWWSECAPIISAQFLSKVAHFERFNGLHSMQLVGRGVLTSD